MSVRLFTRSIPLIMALISPAVFAWQTLTDNIDLSCTQPGMQQLECQYRLLLPGPPLSINARFNTTALDIDKSSYPSAGAVTAILLVVDTSDPGRQNVIDKNIGQIEQILQSTKPYHRIGLASFDKQLNIMAPIGSSRNQIITASKSLRAVGMTTELYRNMLESIDQMAAVNADHKVIFLFSDGQAEDKAYFHQDVINAARKAGVIINTIGYARSVTQSVALQTLRRLSEETGGLYTETDANYNLPGSFLAAPFDYIDNGGTLRINLEPVLAIAPDKAEIDLIFTTNTGEIHNRIPVSVTAGLRQQQSAAPVATVRTAGTVIAESPTIKVITRSSPAPEGMDLWLWYGVPVALIVLIILTLVTLFIVYKRQGNNAAAKSPTPTEFKPYAYLILQDEKPIRYPVTRTTWRIGRSRDNEMTLNDSSVSRRHAEIQRYSNGKFVLFDLDSSNGVYVNNEKIKKSKLEEGDIIEIGDIVLRFTQHPLDYQVGEDTSVQKTKAPAF